MKKSNLINLLVLLLSLVISCTNEAPPPKPPNIFFFFADDWGRYASTYHSFAPNQVIQTPAFDQFAREGVQFNNAHVTSPSCTPCRSSLLSGQYFYRTGMGAILQGAEWHDSIPTYPLLLEQAGYHIGFSYKVWSPGTPRDAPYGGDRNAYDSAGRRFNQFSQNVTKMVSEGKSIEAAKQELYDESLNNFRSFMSKREAGEPFCFWFGPTNTHRKWTKGSGEVLWGLNPDDLQGKMPEFLPDVGEVRQDMSDYLGEVLALDRMFQLFLKELEALGERENTIIVVSGDHGIPGFPRGKCNLYPLGTAVPLLVQWPDGTVGKRVVDDFVNLMDLAPTFLEAAGVPVPQRMTGNSILPILQSNKNGQIDEMRNYVVTGRERHVLKAREGFLPYPQRAIQTRDYLYIRNFKPDREPMGSHKLLSDAQTEPTFAELEQNTFIAYGDLDASPTKAWMVEHRNDQEYEMHWRLGFEKRPEEELYDLTNDPDYLHNVATDPNYARVRQELSSKLMGVLKSTEDPRVIGDGSTFDQAPYVDPNQDPDSGW